MRKLFTLALMLTVTVGVYAQSSTEVSKYYKLHDARDMRYLDDELPSYEKMKEKMTNRITHQSFKGPHDFLSGVVTFLDGKDRVVKEVDYKVLESGKILEKTTYYNEDKEPVIYVSILDREIILGLEMYEYDTKGELAYTTKYRYGGYVTKEKHGAGITAEAPEGNVSDDKAVIWQGTDPDW